MTLTGHCLCGAITVNIKTPPEELVAGFCHCKNCQKVAGSVFSHNLLVPTKDLEVTGELSVYTDTATDSGVPLKRNFCKNCGNPIMSQTPMMGDKTVVKLGIFDDCPKPMFESYTKHRRPFMQPFEGLAQK